jgi:hypothetical protein
MRGDDEICWIFDDEPPPPPTNFWTIIYFYERYRDCSSIPQYLTLQYRTVQCSTAGLSRASPAPPIFEARQLRIKHRSAPAQLP